MNRGYVSLEDYEVLLDEVQALRLENQKLQEKVSTQERIIVQMRGSLNQSPSSLVKISSTRIRPPISPPLSTAKTRSGSVQSRRSFQSLINRSSNFSSIQSIDQEILKAQELHDKAYDELLCNQFSPIKSERLRSLIERWEIEIKILKDKRNEMLEDLHEY